MGINFNTKRVLCINLENTIIKTVSGKINPEDISDFRIQLPILHRIIYLFPNLNYFYIVSNQETTHINKQDIEIMLRSIEIFCQKYLHSYYSLDEDEYILTDYKYYNSLNNYDESNVLNWMLNYWKELNKSEILIIGNTSNKYDKLSKLYKKRCKEFRN